MEVLKDLEGSTERTKPNFDIDGTELYGEDGQTIADISEIGSKEVLEILEIKKETLERVQK